MRSILGRDEFDFRFHCGYNKPTARIAMEDKQELLHCIWLHFVLFQPHAELEQMRKGMYQTLQFELLMIRYPDEVWGLLAASNQFEVTPEYLCDTFAIQY